MNYDIALVIDTGGPAPYTVAEFTITDSIREMLRLAFRETWIGNEYISSQVTWFGDLHGWKSVDAALPIRLALEFLEDTRNNEALSLLEPNNSWGSPPSSWGSLKELIDFLYNLLAALDAHPKTTFFV